MTDKHVHPSGLLDSLKTVELINSRKTRLKVLNYGASLFSLEFLRPDGSYLNVAVSPAKPEDFLSRAYWEYNQCFGASIGRYAGRISKGGFSLDGKNYNLYTHNGVHLHGGKFGFVYKFWKIEEIEKHDNPSVRLSYLSKDGEEGYPGNLQVSVTYTLTEEDEVLIEYRAICDQNTIVNLTNHTYFNLDGGGDITNHRLILNAKEMLEVDTDLFPSGNFKRVEDKMDFTKERIIGETPLDDVFVLEKEKKEEITLVGPESGITLKVFTNQPAVVVYAPETLPRAWEYQTDIAARKPSICLETQNFPDAPHHDNFPSSVLKVGEVYSNKIRWKFEH